MVTKKEVEHIAKLARLGLTEKEIDKTQKDLSLILDYFNLLKEIETEKVKPTFHFALNKPYYAKGVMRKDEIKKQPPEIVNRLIEMAPKEKKGYVRVKSVLS